jgi:peroxiredoxin
MNLPEELAKIDRQQKAHSSEELLLQLDQHKEELRTSGILHQSLQVGDRAPDFSLPNSEGVTIQLSDLLTKGAVVVSFFRGNWCPFCSLELMALEGIVPTILELQGTLLSISPQTSRNSRLTAKEKRLTHPLLIDAGNQVAQQFGIVYQVGTVLQKIHEGFNVSIPNINGDDSYKLPVPATFIIDRSGTIVYRFVDPDFTKRLDPIEIISVLRKLYYSS